MKKFNLKVYIHNVTSTVSVGLSWLVVNPRRTELKTLQVSVEVDGQSIPKSSSREDSVVYVISHFDYTTFITQNLWIKDSESLTKKFSKGKREKKKGRMVISMVKELST